MFFSCSKSEAPPNSLRVAQGERGASPREPDEASHVLD
jgi:hypothetical protein